MVLQGANNPINPIARAKMAGIVNKVYCERFEPRSHFKRRLSLIVPVNVVLNRTVVVDSD